MPGTFIFYDVDANTTLSQDDVHFDLITMYPTADRTITLPDPYEGAMARISNVPAHGSFTLTFNNPDASLLVDLPVNATFELFAVYNTASGLYWDFFIPQALGRFASATKPVYTPTNVATDRSFDANATSDDEQADVQGTVIQDMQTIGLFG